MKRTLLWSSVIVAAFLLVSAAVSSPHVFSPDGEKFDLASLADGETKVFGEGDHKVTATRKGDTVTLNLAQGTERNSTFTCTIGKDSCYVMTTDGEGAGKIAIMKSHTELDGDAITANDEDVFVMAMGEGNGDNTFTWVCDDEDCDTDCIHSATANIELEGLEGLHGKDHATFMLDGHPGASMIEIDAPDGQITLRCPEGDTTMKLKKEQKESGPYFCPQHNVQLEEVKAKKIFIKKIKVGEPHVEEDE